MASSACFGPRLPPPLGGVGWGAWPSPDGLSDRPGPLSSGREGQDPGRPDDNAVKPIEGPSTRQSADGLAQASTHPATPLGALAVTPRMSGPTTRYCAWMRTHERSVPSDLRTRTGLSRPQHCPRLFDALVAGFEPGGPPLRPARNAPAPGRSNHFAQAPDQDAVRTLVGDLAAMRWRRPGVYHRGGARLVAQSLRGWLQLRPGVRVHGGARPPPRCAKSDRRRDRGGARLRHRTPRHDAWLPDGARPNA